MATYANHECAGCGIILPANQLTKWTSNQKVGEVHYQKNIYDAGNAYQRPSSNVYQKRSDWLCPSCARPKRQWRTFWRLFWWIVIIFALIFVVAALA